VLAAEGLLVERGGDVAEEGVAVEILDEFVEDGRVIWNRSLQYYYFGGYISYNLLLDHPKGRNEAIKA
jgi:hypothetical protein